MELSHYAVGCFKRARRELSERPRATPTAWQETSEGQVPPNGRGAALVIRHPLLTMGAPSGRQEREYWNKVHSLFCKNLTSRSVSMTCLNHWPKT
jgi:hypothetical protein